MDPRRFVFLDESGAKTNLTRLYGWAPTTQRVVEATPHGHWQTTTMLSALRLDGVVTAMVVDGATDALVFQGFLRWLLVPRLRPGDIVVLDNLSSHKGSPVLSLIAAAGAEVWYLPPYSPDFNPIEPMWSKVKSLLRSAAARSARTLITAIAKALKAINAKDAQGWFTHCGYRNIQT